MSEPIKSPKLRDDDADVARLVEEIKQIADGFTRDHYDRGNVKLVARSIRELADSFKLMEKYRDKPKVTVFGSARTPSDDPRYRLALEFGRAMAAAGFMVITGAGPGIMEAGHNGAGAEMSIGFNIVLPYEQEANIYIAKNEKLVNLHYFFTRKLLFLKEANAVALFPGGFGTLDEGFEALTMVQTGKCPIIPIVMLDAPGGRYWEGFREYINEELFKNGMISEEDFHLFRIAHSVEEAVEEITGFYRVYQSSRFIRNELVLRLTRPLSDELFARISEEYSGILQPGKKMHQGIAHRHESNEPHFAHLARLYIPFDRKSHGRLRCMIDVINKEA